MTALLPYLQQAAFGQPLRRALKAAGIDVDDLREAAAAAAGTEPPELAKLRRVTWEYAASRSGLLALAAIAVLSFVGGVDFDQFKQALRDASWGWIAAGVIVAQLPRVTQAIATRASVPVQRAVSVRSTCSSSPTSYMNLAVPTSFASIAVGVRFMQRQGVPLAAAVTSGTINTLANNIVQGAMLRRAPRCSRAPR